MSTSRPVDEQTRNRIERECQKFEEDLKDRIRGDLSLANCHYDADDKCYVIETGASFKMEDEDNLNHKMFRAVKEMLASRSLNSVLLRGIVNPKIKTSSRVTYPHAHLGLYNLDVEVRIYKNEETPSTKGSGE